MSNSLFEHPVQASTEQPSQFQDIQANNLAVRNKIVTGGSRVNIPVPASAALNGAVLTPNIVPVTPQQLLSGAVAISLLPVAPTGAISLQLPTAAAMVAAMQGLFGQMSSPAGGASFDFVLVNPAAFTVTPVAGAGFSISAGAAVAIPAGSVAAPTAASFTVVITVPTAGSCACILSNVTGATGPMGATGATGATGAAGSDGVAAYAQFTQNIQGTNNSVAPTTGGNGIGFSFANSIFNNAGIVQTANTQGQYFVLPAPGVYKVEYEMSLGSAGSVGLYLGAGPTSAGVALDTNTVAGSTTATTWIHGGGIVDASINPVVVVGSVVGTAAVVTAGTAAGNFMTRLTFLALS